MNQIVTGHWLADGGDVYIPVGFSPDYVEVIEMANPPIVYKFHKRMDEAGATGSQEGISIVGSSGAFARLADAGGIQPYDSASQLPAIGLWRAENSAILNKATLASITIVARTSTKRGTLTKGTKDGDNEDGAVVDQDALFECVAVSGNTGSSEPGWPVVEGDQVVDGSVTWEKVSEPLGRVGYQGFLIVAALQNNGEECYYLAIDADSVKDHEDVDGWVDGVYEN